MLLVLLDNAILNRISFPQNHYYKPSVKERKQKVNLAKSFKIFNKIYSQKIKASTFYVYVPLNNPYKGLESR